MNEESDIDIRPVFDAADLGADFSADLREKEAALRAKGLGLNAPTFQDGRELVIVGVTRRYTSETRVAIPRQWEFFVGQASQIGGLTGATTYGVCWNAGADRGFDYLTGVEMAADQQVPKDFNTLRIEPRRYAVFAHTDHVSTLPKTIDTIWTKWVPDCGVKIARNAPCFERYTPEFNPQTGMGGMEVWLPLEA
jgi:predicted transcriptional regulator YdeE